MWYLHSPADGGVVLQLPVTISPKLEELPPDFLKKKKKTSRHNVINVADQYKVWLLTELTSASAPV